LGLSEDDIANYLQTFKQGGEEAAKAYEKLMGLLNAKQGRNQASMQALGVDKKTTQDIVDNYGQIRNAIDKKAEAERRAKLAQEEYKKTLQSAKGVVKDWANSIVSGA
jgi:predicted DNA-binding helix-hairpin-helix protein